MATRTRTYSILCLMWLVILSGCAINPHNTDFGLDLTLPEAKTTIYQQAITQFGLMTTIYDDTPITIMIKDIFDYTGVSLTATSNPPEIPRDVTRMVESTLNAIGGNVSYMPYHPEFIHNLHNHGVPVVKLNHTIAITGGITEFDRGLVTKGDSTEFDVRVKKKFGLGFDDQIKSSLASMTLDFNMINVITNTGLPRIQAVNGIKIHKATRSDSIGFTVKSATFGARGEITKVQGRHAATRLLVQLSMLQIVGRYMKLPYWRLVPGAVRDEIVIDQVMEDYRAMSQMQRISRAQELLYLHGYNVRPNGQMNADTQNALQSFAKAQNYNATALDEHLYLLLYENVPITHATRQLRANLSESSTPVVETLPIVFNSEQKKDLENGMAHNDAHLSLFLNKSQFNIGDTLEVGFTVSKPMYVRMVVINPKGEVTTIFPNVYQSDNYCVPGKIYNVPPSPFADFSIKIEGPLGIDKIRAVASSDPIPADHLYFTADGHFDEAKMLDYTVRASMDYAVVHK